MRAYRGGYETDKVVILLESGGRKGVTETWGGGGYLPDECCLSFAQGDYIKTG